MNDFFRFARGERVKYSTKSVYGYANTRREFTPILEHLFWVILQMSY